jgi:hypothetical protein
MALSPVGTSGQEGECRTEGEEGGRRKEGGTGVKRKEESEDAALPSPTERERGRGEDIPPTLRRDERRDATSARGAAVPDERSPSLSFYDRWTSRHECSGSKRPASPLAVASTHLILPRDQVRARRV